MGETGSKKTEETDRRIVVEKIVMKNPDEDNIKELLDGAFDVPWWFSSLCLENIVCMISPWIENLLQELILVILGYCTCYSKIKRKLGEQFYMPQIHINDKKISIELANGIGYFLSVNTVVTYLDIGSGSKTNNNCNIGNYALQLIIEGLKANNTLTSLQFSGRHIDAIATRKSFANFIINNKTLKCFSGIPLHKLKNKASNLEKLRLNNQCTNITYCGDVEAIVLGSLLKDNSILTDLTFERSNISHIGCQAFADALKTNTSFLQLKLGKNCIDDAGVETITDVLTKNTVLIALSLNDNKIKESGAYAIANMLKVNCILTELDLHGNVIGDKGAAAIAEGLKMNSTLVEMLLSNNSITKIGAQAVAEALLMNITIQELWLIENKFDKEIKTNLREILKNHQSLRTLGFRF